MNNKKTTYSTFAVLFYINRQKIKKNGLCPLMGRISINTEVAQFSTKMEIDPRCGTPRNTGSKVKAVTSGRQIAPLKS